uniref:AAA+ ATPase domain-containing protein n=1 Tax=Cyprinodon variegatus TaxID=28743 RepID=A0A3Q2E8R8_CYPVA
LYFKVQKLLQSGAERGGGGAFLADKTHTSLYMGASTNSRVPPCCVEAEPLWSSLSPPGLNKTVDVLIRLILPHLEHRDCTVLLHGPAGSGKVTAVRAAGRRLNLHLLKVDCVTVCADTPAAVEAKLKSAFQRAEALQPCVLLLRNLQLLLRAGGAAEDDGRVQAALCQLLSSAPARLVNVSCPDVVVVATVCRARHLSSGVMGAFVHQVEMESPAEEQRLSMLVSLSRELPLGRDVDLQRLSKLTAGYLLGDLSALLTEAGRAACRRLIHQIPNVRWEDVGGLEQVKKEVLDTVQLPLQRPELLSLGLNRTGVLLYGPPGTGKTLLAKAVATECSMTFLSVKGPELINMYVGQSEENIREGLNIFTLILTAEPPLLYWKMSLLRFDKLVYVGINEDRVSKLKVLKAILRKFQLEPSVNLQDIVDHCPAVVTGADLYALCSDAMTAAIKRKIHLIEDGLDSEDSPIFLSEEDFSVALNNFKPSVSEKELLRYQNIHQELSGK